MKSIIIFTIHKAASMFLHEISQELALQCKMPYYSVNSQNFPPPIELKKNPEAFVGKEGVFCPIRLYAEVPGIENYSLILHLRDPRDVLTSLYYSVAYSHNRAKDSFNASDEQRNKWIEEGIDKFVIERMDDFKQRYTDYCDNILHRDNTIFITYEEMIADFRNWLSKFITSFPLDKRKAFENILYNKYKNSFIAVPEDKMRHKRQIIPGDHKRKLSKETIEILNENFKGILERLNYDS